MRQILKNMYVNAACYIADVEVMTGVSYGTARRIMSRIRKYYGLSGRERPTVEMVQTYLRKI